MTLNRTISILVIDDEIQICRNCTKILARPDYDVEYTMNGIEALTMMKSKHFDIVITDLNMEILGGMEVISRINATFPETVVIVITGYASVSSAVEVMKTGAFDYLPKPFTPYELRAVVQQAVTSIEQGKRRDISKGIKAKKNISHQLIGESPEIKKVIKMVEKVASTDSTVCIYGESGTGKELIARALHANSSRKDNVFFAVDCGTLSEGMLSSELFGHVKGAFTGADRDKPGIFKLANGGTVFLDEISNTTVEIQSRLLRFIETREFMPIGDTKIIKVDVRLIFATNKKLDKMVKQGRFREDFYYRIFVYPIAMPKLNERKMDIMPIASFFLEQFSRKMGKNVKKFDEASSDRLNRYHWPGNVRQLKNVVERAVILCETNCITLKDMPLFEDKNEIEEMSEVIPKTNKDLKILKKEIRRKAVSKVEKNFILNALAESNWNVTKAARKTGLQRTNFQALMKKHKILRQS